jgi:hypothetical protein
MRFEDGSDNEGDDGESAAGIQAVAERCLLMPRYCADLSSISED